MSGLLSNKSKHITRFRPITYNDWSTDFGDQLSVYGWLLLLIQLMG